MINAIHTSFVFLRIICMNTFGGHLKKVMFFNIRWGWATRERKTKYIYIFKSYIKISYAKSSIVPNIFPAKIVYASILQNGVEPALGFKITKLINARRKYSFSKRFGCALIRFNVHSFLQKKKHCLDGKL